MSDEANAASGQVARSLRKRMAMAQRNRQAKRGNSLTTADTDATFIDANFNKEADVGIDESAILPDEAEPSQTIAEIDEPAEEILFCTACAAEALATADDTASDDTMADQPDAAEIDPAELEPAGVVAEHTCLGCKTALCAAHVYREENGTLTFCHACADEKVGICADCGVLHARPCRECSKKVCDDCAKKVIERWGWGGDPGQGGVTSWFPFVRTYCQEHGDGRVDRARPAQKNFMGYDGSSPEW